MIVWRNRSQAATRITGSADGQKLVCAEKISMTIPTASVYQFHTSYIIYRNRDRHRGQITSTAYKDAIQTLKTYLVSDSNDYEEWFIDEFVGHLGELEMVCRKPIPLDKSNWDSSFSDVILVEYRVVHSQSYQVPVLLIRFQTKSGRSLHHNKFWSENLRSSAFPISIDPLPLSGLSEIEHPYLGVPFYQFHPCKTASLMSEVFSSTASQSIDPVKYMIMWFSLIASPLGLHLPQISLLI
ncbi:unnamed protein product [Heterobilharzia americana]|nr:unnamed protein product [Heterobilharzia americana]